MNQSSEKSRGKEKRSRKSKPWLAADCPVGPLIYLTIELSSFLHGCFFPRGVENGARDVKIFLLFHPGNCSREEKKIWDVGLARDGGSMLSQHTIKAARNRIRSSYCPRWKWSWGGEDAVMKGKVPSSGNE